MFAPPGLAHAARELTGQLSEPYATTRLSFDDARVTIRGDRAVLKAVFVLAEFVGLSYRDIADIEGIAEGSVRSRSPTTGPTRTRRTG